MLLTGCSVGEPPEFDREQAAQDELPVPTSAEDWSIDPDTSRYAGAAEGYDLYIGHPADMDGICLVMIEASTEAWESTSCGAGDGVGTKLPSGTGVEVGNFRFPDGTGRIQLSESVAIVTTTGD
ncbi:hypothetical protein JNB62_16305 [Microbacterium jejuense]|uniref:Lipoprotein n=1 Tax=Microbacterium jejuense TaxID=1263637 RepID=A0ABS7HSS2_9MICO|nr:hypothetical protein [Microbacterium jejuense]MBW9095247.1 hypothetical protein [Microbacterium jejuense]